MVEIITESITKLYVRALQEINNHGYTKVSRVGKTLEINGISMLLLNPRTRYIIEPIRKHSLKYIVKEVKWYLSGDYHVDKIGKEAKMWFIIADKNGLCNSNYGAKLFYYKIDRYHTQFDMIIKELRFNQNSRRAIFFLNLFPDDYKQMSDTKDFPCNICGQFMIVNNKLDMFMFQRSADLIYGLSNDIPFFTIVQEIVSKLLNINLGFYHHYITSLHVYEKFYDKLKGKDFKDFDIEKQTPFPDMSINDARALLDQNYNINTPFMVAFNEYEK